MNLIDYQQFAKQSLDKGSISDNPMYLALAVNAESGELGDEIKKAYRDDGVPFSLGTTYVSSQRATAIANEAGDVLWYLTNLLDQFGMTLEDAAEANVNKLEQRAKTRKVQGG